MRNSDGLRRLAVQIAGGILAGRFGQIATRSADQNT